MRVVIRSFGSERQQPRTTKNHAASKMTTADATTPLHAEWTHGRPRRLLKKAQTARWPISLLLLVGAIVVVGLNRGLSDVFRDAGRISSEALAVIFLSLVANALAASWRFQVVGARSATAYRFGRRWRR